VPLECEPDCLDGCARLMLAQSQQMAIAKVLSSGKTFPSSTLAKLLVSFYKNTEKRKGYIKYINEGKGKNKQHPFHIHLILVCKERVNCRQ